MKWNRLILTFCVSLLTVSGALRAATEIACASSDTHIFTSQTEGPPAIEDTEQEAIDAAEQKALDVIFTCEDCELPKTGCNRSYSLEDNQGDPKEIDIWTYEHTNGQWSAWVVWARGDRLTVTCSPCEEPL